MSSSTAITGIILIIIILSTFLNSLVVVALIKRWSNLSSQEVLLLALAASDLLQSWVGYIFEVSDIQLNNHDFCVMIGFSVTSLALTSISILTSLSIGRLLMILYPFQFYEKMMSKQTCLYFLIPSVIYGFMWASFPLAGWSNYEKELGYKSRCSINLSGSTSGALSYLYALLVFCYIVPVSIMIFCFVKIRLEMGKMRTVTIVSGSAKNSKKAEKMFSLLCFIMCIAFLLAWTPYAIMVLLISIDKTISTTWLDISALLGKSQVFYNPIIYAFIYKEFRSSIRSLFGCWSNKVSASVIKETSARHSQISMKTRSMVASH